MALKKTISTASGLTAVDAIHRVEALTLIERDAMVFHVRSYVASDKPFFLEKMLEAPYDIEGVNPIKQAYEHLKTLPEFEGAVDC